MNRMKVGAVGAALALAAAIVGVANSAGAASGTQSATTEPAGCIEMDDAGHQIWDTSKATAAASSLGDALQRVADANQDVIAGVAMCSDYSGVAIFVARPGDRIRAQIEAVAGQHSGARLVVEDVANGLRSQLEAAQRVMASDPSGDFITGVGPHTYTGGLRVDVRPDRWPASEALRTKIVSAATAAGTREMPVNFRLGGHGTNLTTRLADTQPFYGGDELVGATGTCSAGVPIVVSGSRKMLTAGHCTDSSFRNNGNLFGTQYTTAYPGNADIYGDWKLLGGQTYGLRIFSGAVLSSSSLAISGANWTSRAKGLQMCTSGRTTGSVCRYYIDDTDDSQFFAGVWTNNLVAMHHDSYTLGTSRDANGADHGDSGGPCYYSDGAGGVIVGGIVTAKAGDASAPTYYCTKLGGVRAWNSSVYVG